MKILAALIAWFCRRHRIMVRPHLRSHLETMERWADSCGFDRIAGQWRARQREEAIRNHNRYQAWRLRAWPSIQTSNLKMEG